MRTHRLGGLMVSWGIPFAIALGLAWLSGDWIERWLVSSPPQPSHGTGGESESLLVEHLAITFEHSLFLCDRLLPPAGPARDAFIEESIEAQLRFMAVSVPYSYPGGEVRELTRTPDSTRIELLSVEQADYPQSLEVDYPPNFTQPREQLSPYVSAAVEAKRVERGERAIRVRYRVTLGAAMRYGAAFVPTQLRFPLPTDPHLAYWATPASERRELEWKPVGEVVRVRGHASPASHTEVVDLEMPGMYWYVYAPLNRGEDARGEPFDCAGWIKAGVHFRWVEPRVEHIGATDAQLSSFGAPLGATDLWRVSVAIGLD